MLANEPGFAAPHTPRPGYGAAAPRPSFRRWLPIGKFSTPRRAPPPSHARRARASVPSAPS